MRRDEGDNIFNCCLMGPPSTFKKVSFNFLLSDDLAFCGVAPRNAPKSESDVQRFREHSVRERNILKYKMLNNLQPRLTAIVVTFICSRTTGYKVIVM